ncbi:hypothetical protein [Mesorhizobium muleiense]|uniref:hypothetical protein n=1 Tax=Mesorhizobium muleiense TaxID=1004279 RepID=UPI001F18E509|nr:hypothetical protein [Mesorhizobium muleiense]MCF6112371.1 hypothetical protein [Mesorhizobium muleiense]
MPFTLKDVLDALNSAWPIALTILIASVAILTAAQFDFPYAVALPGWSLSVLFVVAMFAAGSCLTRLLQAAIAGGSYLLKWRRSSVRRRHQLTMLNDLPESEHDLMSYFFTGNQQAFAYHMGEHRLVPLVLKGLIVPQSGQHYVEDWPHVIPDHIWSGMKANPEKFRFDKRKDNPLRWMG